MRPSSQLSAGRPRELRLRVLRSLALASGLLTAGVLAAACSGGSASPGVASLGSTTTTTTAPSSVPGSAAGTGAKSPGRILAFVHCMRTHGVPKFPEPTVSANSVRIRVGPGTGVDPGSPQFRVAQATCRHLLPGGGEGPTITTQDQADYLKAVACMRSHGYPQFPDPTFSRSQVRFDIPPSINQQSTQFRDAVRTCEKLIPPGLPYSGAEGS